MHEFDVDTWAALVQRHSQRIEDEVGAHACRELPSGQPAWESVEDEREEELPIVAWVVWFTNDRLHESLGDISPVEFEDLYAAECAARGTLS